MTDPRTELVGKGYDVIGDRFVEWRDRIVGDPRRIWADALTSRLLPGDRVLELGCGAGLPDTRLLAEHFAVTGVDISARQVRRARVNVPGAGFIQADFTSLELEAASFEAVAASYSFNHVPRELLPGLLADIYSWLVPDGLLLAAFGTSDGPGWYGEWLGAPMFFSSFPPETTHRLIDEAGFERVLDDLGSFQEPEGEVSFHWVLARR
jgi:SAM-dependent methyltransferase